MVNLLGAVMSRAVRRHHRARLKNKRRYYWGRDLAGDKKARSQAARTPTPCSCFMCGNARRHDGDTLQERRANLEINWTLDKGQEALK